MSKLGASKTYELRKSAFNRQPVVLFSRQGKYDRKHYIFSWVIKTPNFYEC